MILAQLRKPENPWLLQTLDNPKNWHAFCFIAQKHHSFIEEVNALRSRQRALALQQHGLFGNAEASQIPPVSEYYLSPGS